MHELKIFEHKNFGQIRTILQNENPWFVARDVAGSLGYKDTDDAFRKHCKYPEILKPGETPGLEFGPRGINIIPESDLYRLIMRSKLPAAEKFQDWVVEDVLPALRRTVTYSIPDLDKNNRDLTPIIEKIKTAGAVVNAFGIDGWQAKVSTNEIIKQTIGVDCFRLMGLRPESEFSKTLFFDTGNVEDFIRERCKLGSHYRITSKKLYEAYCIWCRRKRQDHLRKKEFRSILLSRFEEKKYSVLHFRGITLR